MSNIANKVWNAFTANLTDIDIAQIISDVDCQRLSNNQSRVDLCSIIHPLAIGEDMTVTFGGDSKEYCIKRIK